MRTNLRLGSITALGTPTRPGLGEIGNAPIPLVRRSLGSCKTNACHSRLTFRGQIDATTHDDAFWRLLEATHDAACSAGDRWSRALTAWAGQSAPSTASAAEGDAGRAVLRGHRSHFDCVPRELIAIGGRTAQTFDTVPTALSTIPERFNA